MRLKADAALPHARLSAMLLAALGLWLAAPALSPVHVEGFSAQIETVALALARSGLAAHDTAQPALTEFIFHTRQGVSELLYLIERLTGASGDATFAALCACSLLLVLAGSTWFATERSRLDARLALAILVATPGILESGFFFNDNIVSTGFVCAAMALAGPRAGAGRYAGAGLLFGSALLCRLDAVYMLPVIAMLAAGDSDTFIQFLRRGSAFSAAACAIFAAVVAWSGALPWDAWKLAQELARVSQRWNSGMRFDGIAYFYGLIAPLPLALGALPLLRPRRLWHGVALLLYPALFMLHAMNSGNEIRYMLPLLAPPIALHGARGLHRLLHALRASRVQRALALMWLALAAAVLALPPSFIKMKEGPRVLLGRAYTPPMWWRWQDASHTSMRRMDQLLQRLGSQPQTLVISVHWNDEFYLKLRLMEAGYADTPMATAYPGCEGFTVYRDGRHEVLHLRLNNNWQLADMKQPLFAALKLARAAQCQVIARQMQALLTTFGTEYSALDWKDYRLDRISFSSPMSAPVAVDWGQRLKAGLLGANAHNCCVASVGIVAWAVLDQGQLAQLFEHARQMLAAGAGTENGMRQYGVVRAAGASRIERRHQE